MYNRVVLDFGHGWIDGKFDAGFMSGTMDEYSVIAQYGLSVAEAIERAGVPLVFVKSRISPGLSFEDRIAAVGDKDLQVCLHVGQKKTVKNEGLIYHTQDESGVAHYVADAIDLAHRWQGHWYGVKVVRGEKPWQAAHSIHIEPFQLVHIVSSRSIDAIGEVIGNAISLFVLQSNTKIKKNFLDVPR